MKRLAFVGGAVGLGLVAILGIHHRTHAADHLDSPAVAGNGTAGTNNPLADINDVYAWMTTDAAKVNLAMTFSPIDDGTTRHLGPAVQYVLHVTSHPDVGSAHGFEAPGIETKIICTFTDDTHGKCWVVTGAANKVVDYVEGDLSGATGKASASGKFRVFAGLRSDPFFFNLAGFLKAVAQVKGALGALGPTVDAAGCPNTFTAAPGLRQLISTESTTAVPPCAANQIDCFATFNTKAIVVQIDKDELVQGTDRLLSVWGSTHTTP